MKSIYFKNTFSFPFWSSCFLTCDKALFSISLFLCNLPYFTMFFCLYSHPQSPSSSLSYHHKTRRESAYQLFFTSVALKHSVNLRNVPYRHIPAFDYLVIVFLMIKAFNGFLFLIIFTQQWLPPPFYPSLFVLIFPLPSPFFRQFYLITASSVFF